MACVFVSLTIFFLDFVYIFVLDAFWSFEAFLRMVLFVDAPMGYGLEWSRVVAKNTAQYERWHNEEDQ